MKVMCPYCELGGTVENTSYAKIVRCPECQAMFRVSEEVVVDFGERLLDEQLSNAESSKQAAAEQEDAALTTAGMQAVAVKDDSRLVECSVCKFTFSGDFITHVDGQNICPVCAQ